jgi:isocitrate dehydrogenase
VVEAGFEKPVLFERHAVGGEYGAGFDTVGAGTVETVFTATDGSKKVIDKREIKDKENAVVTYHNPVDNVRDLAEIFFTRCLEAKVVPYVVTKKTVFKWQEGFWLAMKEVFDRKYKEAFIKAGLLDGCGHELQHLISDAATMQIIRWTGGGFGMAAHNYDGDMLTDEIAQIHRSPGFITSNLVGKAPDGSLIKEFEASHGTVTDMWNAHLAGKETSLNPLGLVEALIGAVQHSVALNKGPADLHDFMSKIRKCVSPYPPPPVAPARLTRRRGRAQVHPPGVCQQPRHARPLGALGPHHRGVRQRPALPAAPPRSPACCVLVFSEPPPRA